MTGVRAVPEGHLSGGLDQRVAQPGLTRPRPGINATADLRDRGHAAWACWRSHAGRVPIGRLVNARGRTLDDLREPTERLVGCECCDRCDRGDSFGRQVESWYRVELDAEPLTLGRIGERRDVLDAAEPDLDLAAGVDDEERLRATGEELGVEAAVDLAVPPPDPGRPRRRPVEHSAGDLAAFGVSLLNRLEEGRLVPFASGAPSGPVLRRRGHANHARHKVPNALRRVCVLLDLDPENFRGSHLFVKELDDAL